MMQAANVKATSPVEAFDALVPSLRDGGQLLEILRCDGGTRGLRLAGTLRSLTAVDLSVAPEMSAEAIVDKIALLANASEICVGEIAVMARTWQQA